MATIDNKQEYVDDLETQTNNLLNNMDSNQVSFSSSIEKSEIADDLINFRKHCDALNCDEIKSDWAEGQGRKNSFTYFWKKITYWENEDWKLNFKIDGVEVSDSWKILFILNDLDRSITLAENKKNIFIKNLENSYRNANFDRIWLSVDKINSNNLLSFSVNKNEFHYKAKTNYHMDNVFGCFYSNITVEWWKLKIDGFGKKFQMEEWLRVVALVNRIQKEFWTSPKSSHIWGSWNFHRSTFWDLERDIIWSPFDKDILKSDIVSEFFPSIKGDKDFLNYINNLKVKKEKEDIFHNMTDEEISSLY